MTRDPTAGPSLFASRGTRDKIAANPYEEASLDYSYYQESERQSVDRGGTLYPRWRSEFPIADFRFHIWDLRFVICNPKGHAFVPEGLHLDRNFTAKNPA